MLSPPSPSFGPAAAAPVPSAPAKRSAVGLLAVVMLGLLGVGVGALTVAFFAQHGAMRLDGVPPATVVSPAGQQTSASATGVRGFGSADRRRSNVSESKPLALSGTAPVSASSLVSARLEAPEAADSVTEGPRARPAKPMPTFIKAGWPARGAITAMAGTPSGAAGSQADCNPSFDLDSQGRKHFKPECLAARPGSVAATARQAPSCDPNFDLDEQGRKHFKPECFGSSR